ncbi:MAG: hypothetical protein WCF33_07050 [Pseudonocardiaceae bacterium]
MTVTVCLPATELVSIDAMTSVETSVILTTGADRPMSNVPTQLTAFGQAASSWCCATRWAAW